MEGKCCKETRKEGSVMKRLEVNTSEYIKKTMITNLISDSGGLIFRLPKLFLCLFLLVITAIPAWSQHDSLRKYLQIAIENNPTVQQKFTEYRAAMQKVPQAGALPDPEFNLSYFLMPMELVTGKQIAEMNLMQMFPWFGVLKNAKDEMANMAYSEFEEYRETGLQVALDVQTTWFDLYRVRKTMVITRKNIEILKTIEELTLTRYRSSSAGSPGATSAPRSQNQSSSGTGSRSGSSMQGMSGGQTGSVNIPQQQQSMPMNNNQMEQSSGSGLADLYRLKMEIADLENVVSNLEEQEKVLTQRLNIILNRAQDISVFVPDSLDRIVLPQDSLFNGGPHSANPMLEMLEYEKKAYESREKMTKQMGLPMVGLGVGYAVMGQNEMNADEMSESMGGKDMIMPMLSVSIPIWRKKYKAMRREAEILTESVEQRYESISNDLILDQNEALRNYNDAQRRIDLYFGQRTLASNTLELLQTRFSVSSSSLTDILRVQQQLLDYEIREVEAVADLNKSIAVLNKIKALTLKDLNLKNKE
jgi:outer membrane protein TolC